MSSTIYRFASFAEQTATMLWQHMVRGFNTVDHVLRRSHADSLPISRVLTIVVTCGLVYGIAMGSYGLMIGQRSLVGQLPQMIFSGLKVPLLISLTVLISLPSFYVINTLFGLRDDFPLAWRAIVSAQAGLTIILSSLFPLTLFIYLSLVDTDAHYSAAVLFNAAMFGLASVSAQFLLRGYYAPLIFNNPRHRWMIRLWLLLYAFVGIQAGYVLRPFIGEPHHPTTFFRRDSLENAYIKIWHLVENLMEHLPDGM